MLDQSLWISWVTLTHIQPCEKNYFDIVNDSLKLPYKQVSHKIMSPQTSLRMIYQRNDVPMKRSLIAPQGHTDSPMN